MGWVGPVLGAGFEGLGGDGAAAGVGDELGDAHCWGRVDGGLGLGSKLDLWFVRWSGFGVVLWGMSWMLEADGYTVETGGRLGILKCVGNDWVGSDAEQ